MAFEATTDEIFRCTPGYTMEVDYLAGLYSCVNPSTGQGDWSWYHDPDEAMHGFVLEYPSNYIAWAATYCAANDCSSYGWPTEGDGESWLPSLTLEGGALIGAAILGLWAVAFFFRQFMSQIEES